MVQIHSCATIARILASPQWLLHCHTELDKALKELVQNMQWHLISCYQMARCTARTGIQLHKDGWLLHCNVTVLLRCWLEVKLCVLLQLSKPSRRKQTSLQFLPHAVDCTHVLVRLAKLGIHTCVCLKYTTSLYS